MQVRLMEVLPTLVLKTQLSGKIIHYNEGSMLLSQATIMLGPV